MALIFGQSQWQRDIYTASLYAACALGTTAPAGCGRIICRSGGIAWIVAPASSEVSRTWSCRNDAVTTAIACTTATTWFIPTCVQLINPGYSCRTYWDSYSSTRYWGSTEFSADGGWFVRFDIGIVYASAKTLVGCARAFRCVTY